MTHFIVAVIVQQGLGTSLNFAAGTQSDEKGFGMS
jgi:hypothetical protein